ncbi:hypothetical protein HS088_TW18G00445 [Tripterygium wilfordii]|uniref:Cytochrome b5 heme-binding domain-containing protein n=1 Tax=Tripterygium wilfordii TaxID=458696 RepID=A0A7J7CCG0_TRIWF|nr:hypothetical protein HS088_TW18G00445 [Tripterygium wilfordii]
MEAQKQYITSEELKKHNKPDDLWISIQGKVYNVTDWVKQHPGGDAPLLNLAGQDVTDAFIAYHPGTAWEYLDKLFNGYYLQDFHVSEEGACLFLVTNAVAMMFCVVLYGVLRCESVGAHLGSAFLLGFLWVQSAHVGHDSGHYQVMCSREFNKVAQLLSGNCLTGISFAWWKWTHNAHHIACNSLDYDPDLQHIPVFAFLPNWTERVSFVFASFAVTSVQHLQFCLNHFSANVYVGPPSGNDWFEKQTGGTVDISCSPYMDCFFGGLQFQLEHHLFPRLPRCHLRKISPLVQDLCKKHNLPYRSVSFWEANKWTIRTLRTAALQARDLANPVNNLLWEAINTHG